MVVARARSNQLGPVEGTERLTIVDGWAPYETAFELVLYLKGRGIWLWLDDEGRVWARPRSRLPEGVADDLRRYRNEVVSILRDWDRVEWAEIVAVARRINARIDEFFRGVSCLPVRQDLGPWEGDAEARWWAVVHRLARRWEARTHD